MPPSIPALTPKGFVRWQTIQLLLEPEEHVPFLQAAVKRFEIANPENGIPFPKFLPCEALPSKPDLEMVQWYNGVAEKLRLEAQADQGLSKPAGALRYEDPDRSVASSVYSQAIGGPTGYPFDSRSHHFAHAASSSRNATWLAPDLSWQRHQHHSPEHPWTAERRRSDTLAAKHPSRSPTWRPEGSTPTGRRSPNVPIHHRSESSGTVSTISSSSGSSSLTNSSASPSPTLQPSHIHTRSVPTLERRHSLSHSHDTRHRVYESSPHPPPPRPQTSYFPQQPLRQDSPRSHSGPRGHHVRWRDINDEYDPPRSEPRTPTGELWASHRETGREQWLGHEIGNERRRGRMVSPLRGVGGRKYPMESTSGR